MLGGEVEYLGDDYLDRANRQLAPSRTFTGASVAWRFMPALRATFEGRNLGDVHATDVAGFPLPGRSMFVSCQLGAERAAEGHP
jgi:outer membrane receptor protein involved in Fe transport